MSRYAYEVDPRLDPDLWNLSAVELARALNQRCECGHVRGEHFAATGQLGSVGGSACQLCWTCPTFMVAATTGGAAGQG